MIDVSFLRSTTAVSGSPPERQCSFCRRSVEEVRWLVAAPAVSICDDCNEVATSALRRHGIPGFRRWWQFSRARVDAPKPPGGYRDAEERCSFCGESRDGVMIRGESARICASCVKLVGDVLNERASVAR